MGDPLDLRLALAEERLLAQLHPVASDDEGR
jgi:hypothetical protein